MLKPNGTATITHTEMMDVCNEWELLALFREKGVPLCGHAIVEPHPNYTYVTNVDYSRHSMTITWSNKL